MDFFNIDPTKIAIALINNTMALDNLDQDIYARLGTILTLLDGGENEEDFEHFLTAAYEYLEKDDAEMSKLLEYMDDLEDNQGMMEL